jgi:hypothetical protein
VVSEDGNDGPDAGGLYCIDYSGSLLARQPAAGISIRRQDGQAVESEDRDDSLDA